MITAKLYIPEAKAQDMGAWDLFYDANFQKAVGLVVSDNCKVSINETMYLNGNEYVELRLKEDIRCK